jgi:hypothetical protein
MVAGKVVLAGGEEETSSGQGKPKMSEIKWAGNQEAVTFLGYRPIRS